jgi:hypothetical protein
VPVRLMFRVSKVSVKCSAEVFRSYDYHVRFTHVKSSIRTLEVCYEITFPLNIHACDFKIFLSTAEKLIYACNNFDPQMSRM